MKLSNLHQHSSLTVKIDGSFTELGILNRRAQNALSPVYDERFLKIAEDNENVARRFTMAELSTH